MIKKERVKMVDSRILTHTGDDSSCRLTDLKRKHFENGT